jgi:hypothetical protein
VQNSYANYIANAFVGYSISMGGVQAVITSNTATQLNFSNWSGATPPVGTFYLTRNTTITLPSASKFMNGDQIFVYSPAFPQYNMVGFVVSGGGSTTITVLGWSNTNSNGGGVGFSGYTAHVLPYNMAYGNILQGGANGNTSTSYGLVADNMVAIGQYIDATASTFGAFGPGRYICGTNGGFFSNSTFEGIFYPGATASSDPGYSAFQGFTSPAEFYPSRNVFAAQNSPQINTINAVSGSNQLAAFNAENNLITDGQIGGIPVFGAIYANTFTVACNFSAQSAGATGVFYVYHPWTFGSNLTVRGQLGYNLSGIVLQGVYDETYALGIQNQIAIVLLFTQSVTAGVVYLTVTVGIN